MAKCGVAGEAQHTPDDARQVVVVNMHSGPIPADRADPALTVHELRERFFRHPVKA
jgi:hypothetical protein